MAIRFGLSQDGFRQVLDFIHDHTIDIMDTLDITILIITIHFIIRTIDHIITTITDLIITHIIMDIPTIQ